VTLRSALALALGLGLLAPVTGAAQRDGVRLRPLAGAPRLEPSALRPPRADARARYVADALRAGGEKARLDARSRARTRLRARRSALRPAQAAALDALRARARGRVELWMRSESGTPRLLRGDGLERAERARPGRDRDVETARRFLRAQRDLLRLADPDRELVLERRAEDALGRTQLRFGQRHAGLRVWPAERIVHLDPSGDVDALDGASVATPAAATTPAIAAAAAIAAARARVPGGDGAEIGPPELFWFTGSGSARLAWRVWVPASLRERWWVVVDAETGAVASAWNTSQDADFNGSGVDLFDVTQSIRVWQEAPGEFFLVDTSKPMFAVGSNPPDPDTTRGAIVVLDARNLPATSDPQFFPTLVQMTSTTGSAPWRPQGSGGSNVRDGVSALANLSRVYDYFLGVHGRNSLDGAGGSLLAVVRLGQDFQNAFFMAENSIMAFGDAQKYAGALDVVAHELAHGVTHHSANLIYQNESGALNEAFSDIFGESVEAHVAGAAFPDWLVGSPPAFAAPLRNMEDPSSIVIGGPFGPYPERYGQFIVTSADSGGVHLNSSIVNHAYYQLVEGLPNAIGIQKARAIFYRALTTHLTASSEFVDARLAAVQSAQELSGTLGIGAADVQAVRDAFTFVEIGDGPATEPPPPIEGTEGEDATLFVRYDPFSDALFLAREEFGLSDPIGGVYLSRFDVRAKRPAVIGDGSFAVFVDSIDGLCFIPTDGTAEEDCDPGLSDSVASVAVSPDGNVYGFVLLDAFGDPDNQIHVIDVRKAPPDDLISIVVEAPAIDAGTLAHIRFADALDIGIRNDLLVFDALTQVSFSGAGGAGDVEVWAIYAIDLATRNIFTIVPPIAGLDIGYPALAQRTDHHLVFDVVDQATGDGTVFAGDLDSGALDVIAALDGTPSVPAFGVPGYGGDDGIVVFSVADFLEPSGVSLAFQEVEPDRITPVGLSGLWLADADFGVVYRRGDFVPEPAAGALGGAALAALGALALRRRR
jgi:Zn-dependent metalloprotease